MLATFSIFLIFNCFSINYVHSIIGGRDPKPEEARYQVVFQWQKDGDFHSICGGGIVGEKHILTAAHCVINGTTNEFFSGKMRILAGTRQALKFNAAKTVIRDVKRVLAPPNYRASSLDNTASDDIAVLELTENLDLNEEITVILSPITKFKKKIKKLVKLGLPTQKVSNSEKYFGSGFGIDGVTQVINQQTGVLEDKPVRTGKMQVAESAYVDFKHCQKQWRTAIVTQIVNLIKGEHFCVKVTQDEHLNDVRGFCNGDSGSPLIYDGNTVIGVLSLGPSFPCNTNERGAIFTCVLEHKAFIVNAMNYDRLSQAQRQKIREHKLP